MRSRIVVKTDGKLVLFALIKNVTKKHQMAGLSKLEVAETGRHRQGPHQLQGGDGAEDGGATRV